jgi:DNA-binding transcriptional LysR family regulator
MEFDNIETIKRAVEVDHGVAIAPLATVQQEVKQGTLAMVPFAGKEFERPLAILYRKGRVFTSAMKKFIETLTPPAAECGSPAGKKSVTRKAAKNAK